MYVCICRAVTEQRVHAAIDAGADSVEAVTRACRAGDDCGACLGAIEAMVEQRCVGARACRQLPIVRERAA